MAAVLMCSCGQATSIATTSPSPTQGSLSDTWAWDGHVWHRASTEGPSPRYLAMMAYDGRRQEFVLFGGETDQGTSDQTWTWEGKWTLRSPAHHPPARHGGAMAYDPSHGLVVLYGGSIAVGGINEGGMDGGDTWTWDGMDWHEADGGPGAPGARDGPRMVTAGDRVLLYGGHNGDVTFYDDTWTWTGSAWTQVDRAPRPPGRGSPTVAWNPSDSSLFVFSGTGFDPNAGPGSNGSPVGDAWTMRNGTWTKLPDSGPPAVPYSNAIWDAGDGAILVLLGIQCPTPSDAAWTWNGTQWAQAPQQGVPARWGAASAQAPDGHALLFGGSNQPGC